MAFDGETAVQTQRLGGHGGSHVWVAIAVAANPRSEFEPTGWSIQLRIKIRERGVEVGVDARNRFPKNIFNEIETRAYLVGDGGARGARLARQPETRNLCADSIGVRCAFARERIGIVEEANNSRNAIELGEYRASLGFGRMRRENEFNPQIAQELRHLFGSNTARFDIGNRRGNRLVGRRGVLLALAFAEGVSALRLFGKISQIKIERKSRSDRARRFGGKLGDLCRELSSRGGIVRAARFGERANALFGQK